MHCSAAVKQDYHSIPGGPKSYITTADEFVKSLNRK